jgi:hypothetical protein
MISRLQRTFPYRGLANWIAVWSVLFILSQLLWYCSRALRSYDLLEIPMAIVFFPLAPFFDPHDGMVNSRGTFLYALPYWLLVFAMSLALCRKRLNPIVPAVVLLIGSCVASIIYSVFFVYRGPMP